MRLCRALMLVIGGCYPVYWNSSSGVVGSKASLEGSGRLKPPAPAEP